MKEGEALFSLACEDFPSEYYTEVDGTVVLPMGKEYAAPSLLVEIGCDYYALLS